MGKPDNLANMNQHSLNITPCCRFFVPIDEKKYPQICRLGAIPISHMKRFRGS